MAAARGATTSGRRQTDFLFCTPNPSAVFFLLASVHPERISEKAGTALLRLLRSTRARYYPCSSCDDAWTTLVGRVLRIGLALATHTVTHAHITQRKSQDHTHPYAHATRTHASDHDESRPTTCATRIRKREPIRHQRHLRRRRVVIVDVHDGCNLVGSRTRNGISRRVTTSQPRTPRTHVALPRFRHALFARRHHRSQQSTVQCPRTRCRFVDTLPDFGVKTVFPWTCRRRQGRRWRQQQPHR